jgi:hypothetical protein
MSSLRIEYKLKAEAPVFKWRFLLFAGAEPPRALALAIADSRGVGGPLAFGKTGRGGCSMLELSKKKKKLN